MNGVFSGLGSSDGDGGVGALSEDDCSRLFGVLLGELGNLLSDLLDVLGRNVVGFGVGGGLGLVSDEDINVGHDRVELVFEKLRDEGCREVENKSLFFSQQKVHCHKGAHAYLVVCSRVFSQSQDSRYGDSEMVSTNVEELSPLDVLPYLWLLQVVDIVQVGGGKIGAERAVMAGDDDTAAAGGSLLVVAVKGLYTGLLVDILKRLAVLVLANAADVDGRVFGEDVLGTASRVLGSSTGNEHGVVVLDQVLVEAEVLLLGEDGVVCLEAILFKQLLVAAGVAVVSVSACSCQLCANAAEETYPTPWMSRRGFSRASSSKFPFAIVKVDVWC